MQRTRHFRESLTMRHAIQYKGYQVRAAATPLHNGLYAATLRLEKTADHSTEALQFQELDYFYEPAQALAYATRWGRLWIDNAAC
jgi:hypothetical protein